MLMMGMTTMMMKKIDDIDDDDGREERRSHEKGYDIVDMSTQDMNMP